MKKWFFKLAHSPKIWYGISAVFTLLIVAGLVAGCGLPTWLADANQVLPEVLQTVEAVIAIAAALAGKALTASETSAIHTFGDNVQSALQDLETMVQAYNQNNSPSVLSNIVAAGKALVSNMGSFLTAFHVDNQALQTEITDFVSLAVTQLKAWLTLLPALSAQAGESVALVIPMSKKQFADNYNAIRERKTGDAAVDEALKGIKKL